MKTKEDRKETAAIAEAVERYYFQGIHDGDVPLLKQAFHEGALIFGDVKGQPYAKTVDQYLEGVGLRVSPKESGKPYETAIISIDVINSVAMAKVRIKMYDFNYYDFLSFHKIAHQWMIVNKMLTHVDE